MEKSNKTTKERLEQSKQRAKTILNRLRKDYPEATIALEYSNPLELLISTILSAQCTDVRVNMVTEKLFRKYRTVKDYADADQLELEKDIHSTGFYRAKAKNIIACCKALVQNHKGKVPNTMEELTKLAGVGRKTANVVLGGAFGIIEGVVVDTHVGRISQRLGFTHEEDPKKIEQDLMQVIAQKDWFFIGNVLIWHGRKVCDARKPKCFECSLRDLCPSAHPG